MAAYYNENDKFAAAWLRELMKDGLIAEGEVDERDIRQVEPADLRGYSQWHLFAGIGVWSHALRSANWNDSREVLTLSCPCQPFSASGKRKGFQDERHLWPVAFELIKALHPAVLFGEQVASKDALAWYDDVKANMNSIGYAVMATDIPACAFGAPHMRQRLYFVGERQ